MGSLVYGDEGIAKLSVTEKFSEVVILVEIFGVSEIRNQATRHGGGVFLLMSSFIIIPGRLVGVWYRSAWLWGLGIIGGSAFAAGGAVDDSDVGSETVAHYYSYFLGF